jgi:cell wall-associated NlpC family hydrolase
MANQAEINKPSASNGAGSGSGGADSAAANSDGQEGLSGSCLIWVIGGIWAFIAIFSIITLGFWGNNRGNGSGLNWITGNSSVLSAACTSGKLTQADLNKINANKSVYQAAAQKAGIPWEMLAAVHFRETHLSTTHSNPFQHGSMQFSSFQAAADDAATFVKTMAKWAYNKNITTNPDDESVKYAFLAYNRGKMYKAGGCGVDSSPYVMNQFDDAHKNMRWPAQPCEPVSTAGKIDGPAGAFTVYAVLKGKISGSASCQQGIFGGTVIPGGCGGVVQNAFNYLGNQIKYSQQAPHCGPNTKGPSGIRTLDCSGYTSRAYHDAGLVNGNYGQWCFRTASLPTNNQFVLATNNAAIARQILQPGDLILIKGHVVIYGGKSPNNKWVIYESTPSPRSTGGGPIRRVYSDYISWSIQNGHGFTGIYRAKSCK